MKKKDDPEVNDSAHSAIKTKNEDAGVSVDERIGDGINCCSTQRLFEVN